MNNSIKTAIIIKQYDKDTRIMSYDTERIITVDNTPTDISAKYAPVKGDKIWFYPGCDIPRFKVKQFCIKHDVAIVKYREKSSVRFVGPETINSLVLGYYMQSISKPAFLAWLDTVMCNAYMELRDKVTKSESENVYVHSQVYNQFQSEDNFGGKIMDIADEDEDYGHVSYIKDEESYQCIISMEDDAGLYHQDQLLNLLNTGVVMDDKMFDEIHRLFESTDKENTRVAMEAMANCDFQKSAVYLLMLLQKYGSKIFNSGNRHHVNFKSLIKYFQITNISNISVDDMINSLRHQKLLSVDNLNRLMPMAMQVLKESGEMQNIRIKDLELSPEAEKSVAENILDQQVTKPEETIKEQL